MEFVLFHSYFMFSFGLIVNILIIVANGFVLLTLLDKSFGILNYFKRNLPCFSKNKTKTDDINLSSEERSQATRSSYSHNAATNAFLISLCVSNLQVGLLALPLFVITKLDPSMWNLEICKLFKFFGFFSIVSNVYVNVSIAIERFRCVVFKSTYNYTTIVINILLFYVCSFAISFTELQNYEITYENHSVSIINPDGERCETGEEVELSVKLIHTIIFMILVCIVPLSIIITFYCLIIKHLSKSLASLDGRSNKESKSKKFRSIFMKLVFIFFICEVPFALLNLIDSVIHLDHYEYGFFVYDFTFILTSSHAFLILIPYSSLLPFKKSSGKVEPENGKNSQKV